MQLMRKIIKELEEFRLDKKISQQELAAKLGVAFSTVNRWFNDRTSPGLITEHHIKKLLQGAKRWRQ